MNSRTNQRLDRVQQAFDCMPICETVLKDAFEFFRATGELPTYQRLAAAVVELALQEAPQPPEPMEVCLKRLASLAEALQNPSEHPFEPPPPRVRNYVFQEAVYGDEIRQTAARGLLRLEVSRGGDVTSPQFLADRSLPEHNGVSLHLLGWPDCLAKPPYVRQARRLFATFDLLRDLLDQSEPGWFEPIGTAIRRFRDTGELPEDKVVRQCVLADSEMFALMGNYLGCGDAELLAAFDAAAKSKGPAQAEAVAKVQELVRAGRLFPQVE